jgi:hypothetical protein
MSKAETRKAYLPGLLADVSCPASALPSGRFAAHLPGLAFGLALAVMPAGLARLTAPESVGRRCAQLRGSGADLALGPRLVHGTLAFWMQTTGTLLLAVKPCRLAGVRLVAQDGCSACGLLYSTGAFGNRAACRGGAPLHKTFILDNACLPCLEVSTPDLSPTYS